MESDPNRPFSARFLGLQSWQNPMDMWVVQEIITETRPDVIIETGTAHGGSALFYAHILESMGLTESRVVTIDIKQTIRQSISGISDSGLRRRATDLLKKYVEAIESDSTSPILLRKLHRMAAGRDVMVTLDSCHNSTHVAKELELYSPLVSLGHYLIVQDTIIDLKPEWIRRFASCPGYPLEGGPGLALRGFLEKTGHFVSDTRREKFLFTFHMGGFLRRVRL